MSILSINHVIKSYGADEILRDVTATLSQGERVALVGINGAGKSTLLKIIAGSEQADSGNVTVAKGRRIAVLTQEVRFGVDATLFDALRSVFATADEANARMRAVEEDLETADPAEHEALLARYAQLAELFEAGGGHDIDSRIHRVMSGLGFREADSDLLCSNLSGGQRTRAALAQLMLSEPDIMLLDEPTNHLDIVATEWLEEELLRWPGSLMLASHDRYFLDRIAQRVWELDWGKLEEYTGNYSAYRRQNQERLERKIAEFEAQQTEIAQTEEYIRRFGAGQRAREAKGREKRLNRLERIDKPREHQVLKQRVASEVRGGDIVYESDGMLIGYPARPLLKIPPTGIRRQDRIALIGPNGAGKTTVLRTLTGEVQPLSGTFRLGPSIKPSYYAQGHEKLDPERTIFDEIALPGMTAESARGYIAKFLFSGDDVFKRIGDLSGGERSRVALAKLGQDRSNFLILDEPTNHLDIPSQEALADMLDVFDGTLLIVSHDRSFIEDLATQVWAIEPSDDGPCTLSITDGGYADYVENKRAAARALNSPVSSKNRPGNKTSVPVRPPSPTKPAGQVRREDQKESRRLGRQIVALEADIAANEEQLSETTRGLEQASLLSDVVAVQLLGVRYEQLKALIAQQMDEWAVLSEELSTISV